MDKLFMDFSFGLFIWQALMLISIGLWLYCLVDIIKNTFSQNAKVIWLAVVVLLPFLGAILYLLKGTKKSHS